MKLDQQKALFLTKQNNNIELTNRNLRRRRRRRRRSCNKNQTRITIMSEMGDALIKWAPPDGVTAVRYHKQMETVVGSEQMT